MIILKDGKEEIAEGVTVVVFGNDTYRVMDGNHYLSPIDNSLIFDDRVIAFYQNLFQYVITDCNSYDGYIRLSNCDFKTNYIFSDEDLINIRSLNFDKDLIEKINSLFTEMSSLRKKLLDENNYTKESVSKYFSDKQEEVITDQYDMSRVKGKLVEFDLRDNWVYFRGSTMLPVEHLFKDVEDKQKLVFAITHLVQDMVSEHISNDKFSDRIDNSNRIGVMHSVTGTLVRVC